MASSAGTADPCDATADVPPCADPASVLNEQPAKSDAQHAYDSNQGTPSHSNLPFSFACYWLCCRHAFVSSLFGNPCDRQIDTLDALRINKVVVFLAVLIGHERHGDLGIWFNALPGNHVLL